MKTLLDQSIEKSRAGVYQDTSENRRKHRVGQHYGEAKKPEEEGEEKKSKREQRMERLLSYKQNLHTIEEALKRGMVSEDKKEKAEALKASLEEKISKLESKLKIKKDEAKKEEFKKEEPSQNIGPVWYGKDGVSVEEMAKDKKPEFVKRGEIDPSGDPDWKKKSDSINWDTVDLARMGQTIEYLGKIGQFEDGSDMYGIRYYSPNGSKSSVTALGKADYLRNVQRAGFNVRESMNSAVDYINPESSRAVKEIAKMVLEHKTPAEIHDYVASGFDFSEEGVNKVIKMGYVEAEAAQIRMENDVNGITAPVYEKDESDPIPDEVKKLNFRSDEEDINEAIANYLGLEVDPNSWMRVKGDDVHKVNEFWGKSYRRGEKPLSKTAVIEKLKKGYESRQKDANKEAEKTAMREYYASPKGQARLKAFKEKNDKVYDALQNAVKIASENIKGDIEKAGFRLQNVNVYSDGTARISLDGTNRGWGDAEVSYREKWGSKEGRTYEVQTTSYGAVKPGSVEARAVALQGALLSNEGIINSIKENIKMVSDADEQFNRSRSLIESEFADLYLNKEAGGQFASTEFLNEALKALEEE